MATPKVITDGTSAFEEAVLNKFLCVGDANVSQAKLWYGRIRYDGSSWEVSGDADAGGLTVGALAWSDDDDQLEITLSGFTVAPVVVATPIADDDAYAVKAHAEDETLVVVGFYDSDGARVDTESSDMDCALVILGV